MSGLTFELPAVDTGPPAGSVPYPVQAPIQLHDAKLVAGASQSLLKEQRPGACAHHEPSADGVSGTWAVPADPRLGQKGSGCCGRVPLHCYLLCMSQWKLIPSVLQRPLDQPAEM